MLLSDLISGPQICLELRERLRERRAEMTSIGLFRVLCLVAENVKYLKAKSSGKT